MSNFDFFDRGDRSGVTRDELGMAKCLESSSKKIGQLEAENQDLRIRLEAAIGLLSKATAVIDDMRMVDRWNSRVDFDVEELLRDLQAFLSPTPAPDAEYVRVDKKEDKKHE